MVRILDEFKEEDDIVTIGSGVTRGMIFEIVSVDKWVDRYVVYGEGGEIFTYVPSEHVVLGENPEIRINHSDRRGRADMKILITESLGRRLERKLKEYI